MFCRASSATPPLQLPWLSRNSSVIMSLGRRFSCLFCNFKRTGQQLLGFPGGSVVKNLPAVQEMWVQCPGQKNPPEKEMATHSSILAQEIPWTEEPRGLQSMGSQRVRHNLATKQQSASLGQIVLPWEQRQMQETIERAMEMWKNFLPNQLNPSKIKCFLLRSPIDTGVEDLIGAQCLLTL